MILQKLPSLTFADADPDKVVADAIATVESILGRSLARADPLALFVKSLCLIILQQRLLIDQSAKQNLLAYATGDYLDHLGVLVGCDRLLPAAATATLELKLSAARTQTTTIPRGVRISAGDEVYFVTNADVVFRAGETTKTIGATCTQTGEVGNGYAIGELNQIVDPKPFWQSVSNTTASEGGADLEADERYRVRIHESLERFSVSGPRGAYEYWAKTASELIADVAVWSPEPGEVIVAPLLTNGVVPGREILEAVDAVLNDRAIRPLTDKVTVRAPTIARYDVDVDYWVAESETARESEIVSAVEAAAAEFVDWQKARLGRDINPTELTFKLRAAGAKRVVIRAPTFVATNFDVVAIANRTDVAYKGIEPD